MKTKKRSAPTRQSPPAINGQSRSNNVQPVETKVKPLFAREQVVCVEPDGARKLVTIEIGVPQALGEHQAQCPVRLKGLYDDLGAVGGGSTLQALSLALLLVGNLLTRFVQRGGRVLIYERDAGDADEEQDFPFDAYFAPVDGAISEDTALRSLLSVHAAVVGRITPDMRAISFEAAPEEVIVWVYYDSVAPRDANAGIDVELIQNGFVGNPRVRVQLQRVDAAAPIRVHGTLVFALKDERIVQAVA
jgi:hypothetical protein